MNYPYSLGCHLKTGELCRIPHRKLGPIPPGFARIIWFRLKMYNGKIMPYKYYPYDKDGELLLQYYSYQRWTDIQRKLGLPITGPNIVVLPWSFVPDVRHK